MADKRIILAIDDDPMTLKVITALLSEDYSLCIANSAASATDLLTRIKPDLILLDIEMPGISGFEFLHTIRKNPKFMTIPVVIISGHSEDEFVSHAKNMGASCLVAKPINRKELTEKINYAFANPVKHILDR
ncbi:MAG: response regulator [Treponema sp.]|nr:response regulator [Treponema sp.]